MDISELDDRNVYNYVEITNRSIDKEYLWFKNTISVIAIILGLVISLKNTKSDNIYEFYLFSISVLSCGFCILCGLIFLYAEPDTLYRHRDKYMKYILQRDASGGREITATDHRKIFDILRIAFFVFLVLSILSLITYAVVSNYPDL